MGNQESICRAIFNYLYVKINLYNNDLYNFYNNLKAENQYFYENTIKSKCTMSVQYFFSCTKAIMKYTLYTFIHHTNLAS